MGSITRFIGSTLAVALQHLQAVAVFLRDQDAALAVYSNAPRRVELAVFHEWIAEHDLHAKGGSADRHLTRDIAEADQAEGAA